VNNFLPYLGIVAVNFTLAPVTVAPAGMPLTVITLVCSAVVGVVLVGGGPDVVKDE
jgi:hypothetical protein